MSEDNTHIIRGPHLWTPIPNVSLGQFMYDSLQKNSNQNEAFVDAFTGKSITYKQLFGKTCSLASAMLVHKCGLDSMVALCSENTVEFFIPLIAALYVGAITTPINPAYTTSETEHALNICRPKIVFCSKATYNKFVELKVKYSSIEKVIVIDSDTNLNGAVSLDMFIRRSLRGNLYLNKFPKIADVNVEQQIAMIMFSSGTTGLPKGVMLTHKNVCSKIIVGMDPSYLSYTDESKIVLGVLPFYHAYGLTHGLMCIVTQVKVVTLPKFERESYLKSIEKYKVTNLVLVPSLVVFLAKSPLVEKYDLSSVKMASCGGASSSKGTLELVRKRLNLQSLRQGYGMTELTLSAISTPLDCKKHDSIGTVLPEFECKIRNPETGKSLGPNQVGEFCFKGASVMKGYYRDEKATRNAFTSDGWLLTGDLGYYDEDEYFYFVDRLKELIKYKGLQVAPAELEAVLLTNSKIADAGVIGFPNEEAGELPLAFVVKTPNVEVTAQEIEKYVEERVSSYKKLRGGVIFVQEIPKNPSGKILRRKLKEILREYKSKL